MVQQKAKKLNLKAAYSPNCVSSSGLKATAIFVILLSRDGFEWDCPETSSKQ